MHGESNDLAGGGGLFRKDLVLAILGIEQLRAGADTFRRAENQVTRGTQGVMKNRHDPRLQHRLKINEQVAAAD